jgi:hypothetical protein
MPPEKFTRLHRGCQTSPFPGFCRKKSPKSRFRRKSEKKGLIYHIKYAKKENLLKNVICSPITLF